MQVYIPRTLCAQGCTRMQYHTCSVLKGAHECRTTHALCQGGTRMPYHTRSVSRGHSTRMPYHTCSVSRGHSTRMPYHIIMLCVNGAHECHCTTGNAGDYCNMHNTAWSTSHTIKLCFLLSSAYRIRSFLGSI